VQKDNISLALIISPIFFPIIGSEGATTPIVSPISNFLGIIILIPPLRQEEILEKDGFKVKFSKNLFSNTCSYSATAKACPSCLNSN